MNLRSIPASASPARRTPALWRTTGLALCTLLVASCGEDAPVVDIADAEISPSFAVSTAGHVTDLAVTAVTPTAMTVTWTQVADDKGQPASYRVKYAPSPLTDWKSATPACDVDGTRIGAPVSCTIEGLAGTTTYDVQLMSYRNSGGSWRNAEYSNIATGTTAGSTSPEPTATAVRDLAVSGATETTLTVRWTQIDDGTGQPADYRVKYGASPLTDWRSATKACDVDGTRIGADASCTITGLSAATKYDVQLMSYRLENGTWTNAEYSNLVLGETAAGSVTDGGSDGGSGGGSDGGSGGVPVGPGIWIGPAEIAARPTSGSDWDKLLADAGRTWGVASIADQDSDHDVYTLAGALVCVRTGKYCDKARQGVLDAIGTESGARWLAVGRNLGAYVIAADILGLRSDGVSGSAGTRVQQWMEGWLTKRLENNNDTSLRTMAPFRSAANADAQEGFVYAAVAAYLGNGWALQRAWDAFRTFACDPGAPDRENIYLTKVVADGWAHDDAHPCAINPAGSSKRVPSGLPGAGTTHRLDGSLGGDMRRGGVYQWQPGYTQYPWVGLQGFVPAAVILHRAGYPAFGVADRAVLRTHEYLKHLADATGNSSWFDGERAREVVQLVNHAYGASFRITRVVGGGRTVGYTGWTHPGR